MNTTATFPGFEPLVKPFKFAASPYEYKVTALRECPTQDSLQLCETPDKDADYWKLHIATHPHFNPDCECLAVLLLNTRRRKAGSFASRQPKTLFIGSCLFPPPCISPPIAIVWQCCF